MLVKNPHIWFEGEEAGEKVLFMLRPHKIINVGWILVTIFLLALPFFAIGVLLALPIDILLPMTTVWLVVAVWSLMVLGGAFLWLLHWFFNIYILTNRRIVDIDFVGLFHRRVSQAPLRNVEDATFHKKGILPNFFDYGHMHIQTAGTLPNFEFRAVPDPEGTLKQILDLISRVKKGMKVDEPDDTGSKRIEPQH